MCLKKLRCGALDVKFFLLKILSRPIKNLIEQICIFIAIPYISLLVNDSYLRILRHLPKREKAFIQTNN